MVTKTKRMDLKLKGCLVSGDLVFFDDKGEQRDLVSVLRSVFQDDFFDLSASSVDKRDVEVEELE